MAESVELDGLDQPPAARGGGFAQGLRFGRRGIFVGLETIIEQFDDLGGEFAGARAGATVAVEEGEDAPRHPAGVRQVERDVKIRSVAHGGDDAPAARGSKLAPRAEIRSIARMSETPVRSWNWLLALLALLLLPALALGRLGLHFDRAWLFGGWAALSLVTFSVYVTDKGQAKASGGRVPEALLHLLEALGGWPGAFVAQQVVRHKNAKFGYQVAFWIIVALHQVVALDYLLGWQIWHWLT